MSRGCSFPAGLVPFGVLVFSLCLVGSTLALSSNHRQGRQAPAPDTSLVATGTTALQSLPKIILPAMRSLVGAPLRLLRQLMLELMDFLRSHRFLEIYDMRFWTKIVARLPDRAATYWNTLITMESQCAQRTLCDLADLTSRRTPKWFQQIVLIYLNTFSEVHPYYTVAIHGLTSHQCSTLYAECDAEQFLERVRGNVTESIATTVAPMRDAFNDLVTATTSTISSLAVDADDVEHPEPVKPERTIPEFDPVGPLGDGFGLPEEERERIHIMHTMQNDRPPKTRPSRKHNPSPFPSRREGLSPYEFASRS